MVCWDMEERELACYYWVCNVLAQLSLGGALICRPSEAAWARRACENTGRVGGVEYTRSEGTLDGSIRAVQSHTASRYLRHHEYVPIRDGQRYGALEQRETGSAGSVCPELAQFLGPWLRRSTVVATGTHVPDAASHSGLVLNTTSR